MSDDLRTLKDGRYLLVDGLGEGGMATVFRAYDQRLGVWRAIKLLLPEVAKREKLRHRFETEARTMAVLEHKHIVRIYDVDRDGDHLFMVMELVTGGALVDWLEDHGAMPPQMAVKAILETCQGVAYAHKRGVVHRDLKPHNVLLDNDGVCKVTDFGIARAADPERSLTQTGAIMGTHGYMAPEQKVDAKNVDARADVYALGATLWALLVNRPPPDLFVAFQSPQMLEPIPEVLRDVVMDATEYMAEDRYESVEAFAAALREAGAELEPDPRGAPPLARPAQPEPPAPSPEAFNVAAGSGGIGVTIAPAASQTAVPRTQPPGAESTLASDLDAPVTLDRDRPPARSKAWLLLPVAGLGLLGVLGLGLGAAALFMGPSSTGVTTPEPAPVAAPAPAPDPVTAEPVVAVAPDPAPEPAPVAARPDPRPAAPRPTPAPEPVRVAVPAPQPEPVVVRVAPVPVPVPVSVPVPAPVVAAPAPTSSLPPGCLGVTPPASAAIGGSATFAAKLCAEGGTSVVLHYRGVGGGWSRAPMKLALGSYRFQVPVDASYSGGLEYYVTAGELSHGSRGAPLRITVR